MNWVLETQFELSFLSPFTDGKKYMKKTLIHAYIRTDRQTDRGVYRDVLESRQVGKTFKLKKTKHKD